MIKIYYSNEINPKELLIYKPTVDAKTDNEVLRIINDVRQNGDKAVKKYTKKFDHVSLRNLEVTRKEQENALKRIPRELKEILTKAAENIRNYHKHQLKNDYLVTDKEGIILGQKYTAIKRVGVYAPGGTAALPSSALMSLIPAKIAGVEELFLSSPPNKEGKIPDIILAAALIAGADRVFKIGGAQAIAAFAYGTETVPAVDKIVGPGNKYVASAKKQVFGIVGIDIIAGPSEILIISDGKTSAEIVAADLLSQAEHDQNAASILITTDIKQAEAVVVEIEKQLKQLKRQETAKVSIENNGKIIIVPDIKTAFEISNIIAPEHLELLIENPFLKLGSVKNAGSVFLGLNAPEAFGDYMAGTNHILPTAGTARFSSPMSVDEFIKKTSFISYDRKAFCEMALDVIRFAEEEGLGAHAESVRKRLEKL